MAYENDDESKITNIALGKNYTIKTPYSADTYFGNIESYYPDDTGNKLTDGVYGGTDFLNNAFIGRLWQGSRTIILDLEQISTIHEISLNTLQDIAVGIYFPGSIAFSISHNGKAWENLAIVKTAVPTTEPGPLTQKFTVTDINKEARYVQLNVSVETWLFMDELEVWGTADTSGDHVRPSPNGPKGDRGYPIKGSKQVGGINNMVLIYTGEWQYQPADWISFNKEDFKPYVSYVDENMVRQDYMFDGFLFLPYGPLLDGANYGTVGKPTNKSHFEHFLDRLFRDDYELGALNEAVKEAKAVLPNRNYKAKVVIAIPYPRTDQSDFGDVDGDGISENLNVMQIGEEAALQNRMKVVKWYVDEVYRRWNEAAYDELELVGFYWYNEYVALQLSNREEELLQWTGDYVRSKGVKFQWIPYYFARGWNDWKRIGFDSALMQPNFMFHEGSTPERLNAIAEAARENGMGIEIEMNDSVLINQYFRDKYYAYLDKGKEFHYMVQSYSGFYQQVKTLLKAAKSSDPAAREVYDQTYKYLKGTYKPKR
ncbi:MAG: Glycerophosphoryl diester phosphodiesterase [Candidatus Carbobacillus altaicus]|uniref:Glycerophosphoryl diester phosphodiesterase n=1 Tax=Candidatus Carbonibacillus altaicus TaxID=2163959 RepID=A0A2R6Y3W5_9BACL|nr:MAG: Glycerophosphoryl diester phosphodiesterase [Candidatus Carbobacillus altaicus]